MQYLCSIYVVFIRVVNDTQKQSFETVSNAKFKVSKQYQKLKSKFRNTAKANYIFRYYCELINIFVIFLNYYLIILQLIN